jgi:hypothetical protein
MGPCVRMCVFACPCASACDAEYFVLLLLCMCVCARLHACIRARGFLIVRVHSCGASRCGARARRRQDAYANYAIQTAMAAAPPGDRARIVDRVRPCLVVFNRAGIAPSVLVKWEALLDRLEAAGPAGHIDCVFDDA